MASEYGVPQNRRRACSVGLKNSKTFSFPEPTTQSFITCEQAIGDLPNETIGDVEGYSIEAQINYQRLMRMDSNISYFLFSVLTQNRLSRQRLSINITVTR